MTLTSLSAKDLLISKGPLISILTSRGSSGASNSINIPQSSSGWGNNVQILDALTCNTFNTASNGALSVPIESGMPRVLIESSKKGNLCAAVSGGNSKSGAGRRIEMGLRLGLISLVGGVLGWAIL